jgi:hypothetical protein
MLRTKSICNNKHELYWAVNPPFGHYLSQLTYQVTVETSLPATFYQACGNNNILRTANNDHTFRNAPTKGVSYVINFLSDIETLYDCCVYCDLTASSPTRWSVEPIVMPISPHPLLPTFVPTVSSDGLTIIPTLTIRWDMQCLMVRVVPWVARPIVDPRILGSRDEADRICETEVFNRIFREFAIYRSLANGVIQKPITI